MRAHRPWSSNECGVAMSWGFELLDEPSIDAPEKRFLRREVLVERTRSGCHPRNHLDLRHD